MSNNKQYINIIKNSHQLKVDYQVLDESGNILSNEKSVFLQTPDHLSEDAVFKITSLEQNIQNTHTATLLYNDTQKIINNEDSSVHYYENAKLNETQSITCDKNLLFETTHYFQRPGIDYVFSPFSILYLHAIQTTTKRLNTLILENKIYFMILDDENRVLFSQIKNMTSFDDIKNSDFYSDEIDRQKLFDEINLLEISKYITEAIEIYYKTADNFLTHIDIVYTLKQLTKEQIEQLEHKFDMNINYRQISIDESLYELSMLSPDQSFTTPRDKTVIETSSSKMTIIAALTSVLAIVLVYFLSMQNVPQPPKPKVIKQQVVKKSDLPNHIDKNNLISGQINNLLNVIPYSMVLDELTVSDENSTLTGTLLSKNTFITEIQPQLLKQYVNSSIKYEDEMKETLTKVAIENTLLKNRLNVSKTTSPEYIIDEFIPKERIIEQIKQIVPQNAIINYKTKYEAKITTYNFMINVVVAAPQEFFNIIEKLNEELYSIHINYPVNMRKTPEGIEINFILQFHQY